MKVNRTYCIDEGFAELLSKTNASALINELLRQHFEAEMGENPEQIRLKTAELVAEKRQIMQKIKHFKAKSADFLKKKEAERTKNQTKKEKEARELEVETMKRKWQNEEITDEEFYAFCDG